MNKTKIISTTLLMVVISCGSKKDETRPSREEVLPAMSAAVDYAPENVLAIVTIKSFKAAREFDGAWAKQMRRSEGTSSLMEFLATLPGFSPNQGGDFDRPLHILVSSGHGLPVFNFMAPYSDVDQFDRALSVQRTGALQGNDFYFDFDFDDSRDRLYGNSIGGHIVLSAEPGYFAHARDFLSRFVDEAPPKAPFRLLIFQHRLQNHHPALVQQLEGIAQIPGSSTSTFGSIIEGKGGEIIEMFRAMEVGQYEISIQSQGLAVEVVATWRETHPLKADFAEAPCALVEATENLPPRSYVLVAHCLRTLVMGADTRMKEFGKLLERDVKSFDQDPLFAAIRQRARKNFRAEATALYGKDGFPFSILSLSHIHDGALAKKDASALVQWLLDGIKARPGGDQGPLSNISDLNALLQLVESFAPMLGLQVTFDKEAPVVGLRLKAGPKLMGKIPPSVASMLQGLLANGLEVGVGFEPHWSGSSFGPDAWKELEDALKGAGARSVKHQLRPTAVQMRYLMWIDLVAAYRRLGPMLTMMGPESNPAATLLMALQNTPTDTALQLSFGGNSERIYARFALPFATINFVQTVGLGGDSKR